MLRLERFSETELFRRLSEDVFRVHNFQITKSMRVICHLFFGKILKITSRFQTCSKIIGKFLCFWDNCILISIIKLSLLRPGYFSLEANVLTSSPKIWPVNKRDFFQLNFLGRERWVSSRCCNVDFNSAWARLPSCLSKGPLKQAVLDIYLTTFSESVISEIQKLRGSPFFFKMFKT